ncbi:MAG: hypothetical protein AAGA48_17590 [Myxococcota bacterium]
MISIAMLWVACSGSDKGTDSGTDEPFTLAANKVQGGVMLSAFTLGDEMVMAGGSYGTTGSLWRYDGDELCVEENVAEGALWWLHGRSATDFYAVGDAGIIIHEVDGTRTREDLPDDTLTNYGVYDDGSDVWVVSGDVRGDQTGEIWRKEAGGKWTKVADTPGLAFKVHEDWFVGDGFAWRWNGTDFDDLTPKEAPRLLTVRVRGENDVWAVGGLQLPEFWHWDGATWSRPELDTLCVGQALNGVITAPGEPVYVTGNFGTVSAYEDDGTYTCASFPVTAEHFHAVWTFGGEVLAVGGNLFAQSGHYATIARSPARGPITFAGACAP